MPTFDSASAIFGGRETGRHLLRIEGYSHIKGALRNGERVESPNPNPSPPGAARDASGFSKFSPNSSYGSGIIAFIHKESLEASEYLVDDCFKIGCEISVAEQPRTENRGLGLATTMSAAAVPAPPSDLHRHLGDLLVAQDGADVAFQVAGETFRAHSYILAARSPVFRAELDGVMREQSTSAGVGGLRADRWHDASSVRGLAAFRVHRFVAGDGGERKGDVQMLEAAGRYGMQRLKLICEEKLCTCLDTDTVATTMVLAEQRRCHGLKTACIEFIKKSPPQALDAVMATDGFENLVKIYPALLGELFSKLAARG
ncbi:unnamed protein product [Urochloa decumbens]|uniref:BTB domain-containing protein n=1 Tax=Urochloa decumbens TaxID=240449 RepID=A0ABC8WYA3_9POAL